MHGSMNMLLSPIEGICDKPTKDVLGMVEAKAAGLKG